MTAPSAWENALTLDDPANGTGDADPVYYYGGSINAVTDPSYAVTHYDGPPYNGLRPAYLKILPTAGTRFAITVRQSNQDASSIFAGLWEHDQFGWSEITADADDPAPRVSIDAQLEAGHEYYVVMSFATEAEAQARKNYLWGAEVEQTGGSDPPTPGNALDFTPVAVAVAIVKGVTSGTIVSTDIPPIAVSVVVGSAATWDGEISLTAPPDGVTIVTDSPQFMVGVDVDLDDDGDDFEYIVEVQYDDNTDFTHPVTLTSAAMATDGGAVLTAGSPVPAVTYWRARVLPVGALPSPWTETASFTVSAATTATELPVTWSVNAAVKRPIHLWHVFPAGPDVGDIVTIYGQGFPESSGKLTFGSTVLTATSWKRVVATAENDGTAGLIQGDTVDPEHYEITFVAPDYTGHGDVLTVGA